MSGQLNDDKVRREFKSALQVLDWIYKKKIQLPFPLTADLLDAYTRLGHPTWFELYEFDAESLFTRITTDLGELIGVTEESLSKTGFQIDTRAIDELKDQLKTGSTGKILGSLFVEKMVRPFIDLRCALIMMVGYIHFREPVRAIVKKARVGDTEAVLRLVKLDHGLLFADYVEKVVLKAELSNDKRFARLLATALRPDPEFWSLKGQRKFCAMWILYHLDNYSRRSDSDWALILGENDFLSYTDPENVRRARARYGLNKPIDH
jgi:hypothetical protein